MTILKKGTLILLLISVLSLIIIQYFYQLEKNKFQSDKLQTLRKIDLIEQSFNNEITENTDFLIIDSLASEIRFLEKSINGSSSIEELNLIAESLKEFEARSKRHLKQGNNISGSYDTLSSYSAKDQLKKYQDFPKVDHYSALFTLIFGLITTCILTLIFIGLNTLKESPFKMLVSYLSFSKSKIDSQTLLTIQKNQKYLSDIQKKIDEGTYSLKNNPKLEKAAEELIKEQVDSIKTDKVWKEILDDVELRQSTQDAIREKRILEYCQELKGRIKDEIGRLTQNASVNLVIGMTITAVALLILIGTLYWMESRDELTKSLLYLLPRITLTILVQIFSFFFLRLYRSNLADVKYWSNERTNVDFKILSMELALQRNDKKVINKVIDNLLNTERNFVLTKGQTTVDIEKSKVDYTKDLSSVIEALKGMEKK